MKTLFPLVLLFAFTTGFVNNLFGQINNSEVFFYEAGKDSIYVVKYDDSKKHLYLLTQAKLTVKNNLMNSIYYYENDSWSSSKNGMVVYEYKKHKHDDYESYNISRRRIKYKTSCTACNSGDKQEGCSECHNGCGKHGYEEYWDVVNVYQSGSFYIMEKWSRTYDEDRGKTAPLYTGCICNRTRHMRLSKEEIAPHRSSTTSTTTESRKTTTNVEPSVPSDDGWTLIGEITLFYYTSMSSMSGPRKTGYLYIKDLSNGYLIYRVKIGSTIYSVGKKTLEDGRVIGAVSIDGAEWYFNLS